MKLAAADCPTALCVESKDSSGLLVTPVVEVIVNAEVSTDTAFATPLFPTKRCVPFKLSIYEPGASAGPPDKSTLVGIAGSSADV